MRLITKSLMIVANQCIVRSRWLCGTGLRRVRQRSGRAGVWYFCGNNILPIIFISFIICAHARSKRSRISVRGKIACLLFCLFCDLSAAYCYIVSFDVLKFLTFLVSWKYHYSNKFFIVIYPNLGNSHTIFFHVIF